jgi:deubiquitinase DESI2
MYINNEPIYLNIYDIYSINNLTRPFGIGFYHLGIEIYGTEYSFNKTGIFTIQPKTYEKYPLRETIYLGQSDMNFHDIYSIILKMDIQFNSLNYNLFHNNSNDFCNLFLNNLSVYKIPSHINRLSEWTCILYNTILKKECDVEDESFTETSSYIIDDLEMQKIE